MVPYGSAITSVISVWVARFGGFQAGLAPLPGLAPKMRLPGGWYLSRWSRYVRRISPKKKEERKWARLQLAIPVFIRTRDRNDKDSLEFATAVNISPGGALVVVRRSLPKSSLVSLEIPSAPVGPATGLKTSSRIMHAKAVWVAHLDDYHLLGLKFTRPLGTDAAAFSGKDLRRAGSAV